MSGHIKSESDKTVLDKAYEIYLMMNGLIVGKTLRRHKIAIYKYKPDEGVLVKDGRPVKKIDDKWVYILK
jgi:hypothetical protein